MIRVEWRWFWFILGLMWLPAGLLVARRVFVNVLGSRLRYVGHGCTACNPDEERAGCRHVTFAYEGAAGMAGAAVIMWPLFIVAWLVKHAIRRPARWITRETPAEHARRLGVRDVVRPFVSGASDGEVI